MASQKSRRLFYWASAVLLPALLNLSVRVLAQTSVGDATKNAPANTSIWTRVNTPNIGGADILESLSADSEQDIWAVGDFVSLNFNGTAWTAIPLADPPGEFTMNGVAALSPTNVWAVGSSVVNSTHFISVIEHYDGTKWSIVASPQFANGSELVKLHAIAADDIFAVGGTNTDSNQSQQAKPLVEHFDGQQWSTVSLPSNISNQNAFLHAIDALSSTDLWVAGNSTAGVPLVLHFDGQQFNPVPFPVASVSLGGIAMIATNDAWITGSDGSTLAAHWDGSKWTRVPTPNAIAGASNGLNGVSAISSNDVWAAGSIDAPGKGFLNLVEHWDGTRWTISPILSTNKGFDILTSALAFPSGSVYVAGTRLNCSNSICAGFASVVFHTTQGN